MTSTISSRQAFPDQLRGLALLGIVVVNAPFMAISAAGYDTASVASTLDRSVAFAVTMFAQGKFYLLFSFLFGYSALFIIKDDSPLRRRVYRRRLAALAVLGIAHMVFFFVGDILFTYAILGLGLLLLFHRSDTSVWITAGIVAAVSFTWIFALALLSPFAPPTGEIAQFVNYDQAMATGSFLDAALARIQLFPIVLVSLIGVQWGYAFTAFALGLIAARHRFLGRLSDYQPIYRRFAVWGLAIGLPLQFAAAWFSIGPGVSVGREADGFAQAASALGILAAPVLSFGYLGALGLLSLHLPRLMSPLAAPGRASLTIYLGESVLLTVIFAGWGFGLFGELGAAAVTLIAVGTWLVLAIAMTLWQRRFAQGPMEALTGTWTKRPLRQRGNA